MDKKKPAGMKSINAKILWATLCILVVITVMLSVLSIAEVNNLSGNDSAMLMTQAMEKETIRFDDEFRLLENSVVTISQYIKNLENESESENELLMKDCCNKIQDMALSIANRTDGAMAVYFRYDPELLGYGTGGFFWSRDNDNEEFSYVVPTDILAYDQNDTEHVGWFYEPKKKREAMWMSPYYNKNLDVFMISYVVPYYTASGDFLGVIGMDIDFDKIVKLTDEVSLYKSGEVSIIDLSTYSLYSTDENGSAVSEDLTESLYNHITTIDRDSATSKMTDSSGNTYLTCVNRMSNGMRLLLSVPLNEINEQRNEMLLYSAVVMVIMLAVSIFFMVRLTNKIVNPLKKLTKITEDYAGGRWDETFLADTEDEVQQLSESISVMAETTKSYIDKLNETAEKEKIARNEADSANKAKGQFLANMSHEIRTPINAILGMDTMILRESNEPGIKEFAMDIKNAGNILLSLINDILDFSKIDAGKMEIVPTEYEFTRMVDDVMNMVRFKAETKKLSVNLEIDENLPSGLYGDDIRIKQIITNLMNNAVKYTEKGGVTLVIGGETSGDYVTLNICVRDTGIGIREEDLSKLTEKFVRIEEARNKNIEGTGLGMSIALQLLELMDSKLEVSSVYGQGSDFSFSLRQKITDGTPIGDIKERLKQNAQEYEYESMFTAPDARVIVVDDNAVNRMVFIKLLKETKLQIDEADGGRKALELIFANHYDIIFLDHMMPDMDGFEVLKRIKENQDHPNRNTPVIALTANAVSGAKETYLSAGFDDYLDKPIIPEKLEGKIASLLPEDKKKTPQKSAGDKGSAKAAAPIELPMIEGIDWNYAKLHIQDAEMLMDTVKNFARSIDSEADALEKLYDEYMTSSDAAVLDTFRIKVHAIKSTTTLLGFVPIAGMAATLEYAARDGKSELIRDMTPHFLKALRDYNAKLDFAKEPETEKTSAFDASEVSDYITRLKEAMWDFDVHGADEAFNNLNKYSFGPDNDDLMSRLSAAVSDLDADTAVEICDELLKLVNGSQL